MLLLRVKVRQVAYGDVEHFRPKACSQQSRGARRQYPGYYWLAYAWCNLLFACERCNRGNGKRDLFPLLDPARRILDHRAADKLAEEQPMLVDPLAEDPEAFVGFSFDLRRDDVGAIGIDAEERGFNTICALDLNRSDLVTARLEQVERLYVFVEMIDIYRIQGLSARPAEDHLKRLCAMLAATTQDDAPYANMARCFLRQRILFSRDAVGWLIATRESATLAQRLLTETYARAVEAVHDLSRSRDLQAVLVDGRPRHGERELSDWPINRLKQSYCPVNSLADLKSILPHWCPPSGELR